MTNPTPKQKIVLRIRMCDADREEYGGDEWLTFDHAKVEQIRANQRMEIEDTIGMSVPAMVDGLAGEWPGAHLLKAVLWLTRRLSGLVDAWATFDPHVDRGTTPDKLQMRFELLPLEGGDADPPASSSVPGGTTDASAPGESPPTTPGASAPATG